MRLGSQMVDFVRSRLAHDPPETAGVCEVPVVQEQPDIVFVAIPVHVIDAVGIEARRAPDHPMHDVSLVQQVLSQIRAVLASNACDQSGLHRTRFSCAQNQASGPAQVIVIEVLSPFDVQNAFHAPDRATNLFEVGQITYLDPRIRRASHPPWSACPRERCRCRYS